MPLKPRPFRHRNFTHAAHIAVALSYLQSWTPAQALEHMRKRIRAFAAHHGVGNLYHETLTIFWIRLLDHVARTYDVDPSRSQVAPATEGGSSTLAPDQLNRRALGKFPSGRSALLGRRDRFKCRARKVGPTRSVADAVLIFSGASLPKLPITLTDP